MKCTERLLDVFSGASPCSLDNGYYRFDGTCCFYRLIFYPEIGGSIFLQKLVPIHQNISHRVTEDDNRHIYSHKKLNCC
jgi:hypothetical protein